MPQTIEAIHHTRNAKVPLVLAINKIDKPEAQPERVPAFLRRRVRASLEAHARKKGVGRITAEFVRAYRPRDLAGSPGNARSRACGS